MIWDEGLRTALPATSWSSLLSAQRIFGGRRTVDGQRCFEQRSAGSPLLSVQRLFCPRSGTRLCEAKTGQAKPDWPPKVTGIISLLRSSITSPEAPPGITSAGDLSAHHFPTKSASPPAKGSLASTDWLFSRLLVSAANVATMLFLDGWLAHPQIDSTCCRLFI